MKEIIIKVPDNCELKQDGNTYTIVEKEKKLTYDEIAKRLFRHKEIKYTTSEGIVGSFFCEDSFSKSNNFTSERQAEKLLAINKLMNVAKYLNGDWQPNWGNEEEGKYFIQIENVNKELYIDCTGLFNCSIVYFMSEELAKQAIDILGEETIKLALCTDY